MQLISGRLTLKFDTISRVSSQNGVALLYIMLEIHHSGWEPSISFHAADKWKTDSCRVIAIVKKNPLWFANQSCLFLEIFSDLSKNPKRYIF